MAKKTLPKYMVVELYRVGNGPILTGRVYCETIERAKMIKADKKRTLMGVISVEIYERLDNG